MRVVLQRLPSSLLLVYAVAFAFAARAAHVDSEELNYPTLFLILGAASSVTALASVVLFALRLRNQPVERLLRAFFPVAVIAKLWAAMLDATAPSDYSLLVTGLPWLLHAVLVVAFVGPAYLIYYVYAHPADA